MWSWNPVPASGSRRPRAAPAPAQPCPDSGAGSSAAPAGPWALEGEWRQELAGVADLSPCCCCPGRGGLSFV